MALTGDKLGLASSAAAVPQQQLETAADPLSVAAVAVGAVAED